jgi:polyhydroxyalkanoate synthesis regulator phasin
MADMADVHEQIRALQVRVSKLETWAGPGQADALSAGMRAMRTEVADIRRVQRQHTGLLSALNRDVAALKTDVAGLKTDVAGLKGDVAVLKADVAGLKEDVAVLKADMADVKVTLAEILRRLPPAAA